MDHDYNSYAVIWLRTECSCLFLLMNWFFFSLWLFKPFKLLNEAINPGITTGKVNYGSCLETLQRECASSVSGSHAVSMNTHVASVYPHTQFTQTFIKSLRIHIYSNTHAITQYTRGYPPESKDMQRTVDTVFCRLLAGALWAPYFMVIHLFLPEKTLWLLLLLRLFQCPFFGLPRQCFS